MENYSIVNRDRQELERRRGDVAIVTSIQVLLISAVEASLGVSSIRLRHLTRDGTQDGPEQRVEEMLCVRRLSAAPHPRGGPRVLRALLAGRKPGRGQTRPVSVPYTFDRGHLTNCQLRGHWER